MSGTLAEINKQNSTDLVSGNFTLLFVFCFSSYASLTCIAFMHLCLAFSLFIYIWLSIYAFIFSLEFMH